MQINPNPFYKALIFRGIDIPDSPVNLSASLIAAGVSKSYVIGMTGRCGSTWLASELEKMGGCGSPREYFSEEAVPYYGSPDGSGSFEQYFTSLFDAQRTGECFGFKIDGMRLGWLSSVCDLKKSFGTTQTAWIDMRRLNFLKQAFSFARAKITGVWHVQESDNDRNELITRAREDSDVPDERVWQEVARIIRAEKLLDSLYEKIGVNPLRIFYEELVDSKKHVMVRVLSHIWPEKIWPLCQAFLVDPTVKISSESQSDAEVAFLSNNAVKINKISALRYSSVRDPKDIDNSLTNILGF